MERNLQMNVRMKRGRQRVVIKQNMELKGRGENTMSLS
jgi:hypothetical protein